MSKSNQFTFASPSQLSEMHFILKAVAFTFAVYLMGIGTDNCLACPFAGNFNCSGINKSYIFANKHQCVKYLKLLQYESILIYFIFL